MKMMSSGNPLENVRVKVLDGNGNEVPDRVIGELRELDGRPVGVGMAFVRRLAHFLDSLPIYLGWLWPLWDDKKQTFADKVCGTVVIKG